MATDSANAQLVKPLTITVNDLPELAGSGGLVIGDGSAQRSSVRELTVKFDGAVAIETGAFAIAKRGTSGGEVNLTVAPSINGSGQTVVVLTFSGQLTRGNGALSDGY